MALNPADIATVSRLLDDALALDPAEREAWLAALPSEHQRHAEALRGMLTQEAQLDSDNRLDSLPRLSQDDAVAHADDRIGPYRLLREIGRGGMGSVWLAERADGAYKRQVALKLPRLAWGAGLAERMAREREIGMLLEHPHIARLYDAGVDERGRPFLALEYIDGLPIDVYAQAQRLELRALLRLFVVVVRAVAYAHGRLVVHRDLKPSNVLVSPDGEVHLLDFGIAKLLDGSTPQSMLTQQQGRVMTPVYASPEQVAGDVVTVQSDVYSLGVLLYELLTGRLLFEPRRRTLGATEEAILEGDAAAASSRANDRTMARALRGEVDAIIGKAMRRDPTGRYPTADALAQDIGRYLAGETVSARPDSLGYRLRKVLRRHWLPLTAGAAVAATVLVGGTIALLQTQRALQQAERAKMATQFVSELFRASAAARPAATTTASTLLDRGAQLLQTRFPNQPDLQAELFGVVGRAYAELGANTAAVEFANRELALLETLPTDATRRAQALMLLARIALEERRDEDAERDALRATRALAIGDEAWADAQVLLSRVLLKRGRADRVREATARLEHALQASGRAQSSAMAWILWLKGDLANDSVAKTALRQQAVEVALKSGGATAADTIEMQLGLAGWLNSLNRAAEAAQYREAALGSLRSMGGTHAVRAALAEIADWTFRCELVLDPLPQAMTEMARLRAEAERLSLVLPAIVGAKMDWAESFCAIRWGDIDAADRLMAGSAPVLLASSQSLGVRLNVVSMRGWVSSLRGQHEQADVWLRERLALHLRIGSGAEGFMAYAWAFLAMNEVMRGDLNAARAVLARAPAFPGVAADTVSGDGYARVLPAMHARVLLEAGQAAQAQQAMPPLPRGDIDEQSTFPEYALKGEIDCAAGQREAGLTTLLASIRTIAQRIGPQDAGLARIRAVAGLCALDQGRPREAAELAAAARAALAAHAQLSPWFGRPLAELEQRLARR